MAARKKLPENYMDMVFTRASGLSWKEREDGVVVLDVVNKGFYHLLAQTFFHRPPVSHIALDRYGTVLWLSLDGKRDVSEVLGIMENTFPNEKEQMLKRVVSFLCTLQTNHYIRRLT